MIKSICNTFKTITGFKRALLLLVLMLAGVASVWAYDFEVDGLYYDKTSDTEVEVVCEKSISDFDNYTSEGNYSAISGELAIPETIEYDGTLYDVTSIGKWAFCSCEALTEVIIPESVTVIGWGAFRYCSSLSSVIIPSTITEMGGAFECCNSLVSFDIPEGITSTGSCTFYCCESLREVTIPESVTEIEQQAFRGCSSLAEMYIPESVTYIGINAFEGCSSLISVNIPKSVTKIESFIFSGCSSLTSISIPEGVTSIGFYAFEGCSSLTEVTIPEGVTSIETAAFMNCTSLMEINVLNPMPVDLGTAFTFYNVDKENCVLNVPVGSEEKYAKALYWRDFLNIVEVDFGGIEEIISDNADATEVARYDIGGRLLMSPELGVNIVCYSDGTVRKVIVK